MSILIDYDEKIDCELVVEHHADMSKSILYFVYLKNGFILVFHEEILRNFSSC